MNKIIFDIAIIGAGPAGLFAAFEAGSQDMSVAIIDILDMPGGQCAILYPEKFIYDMPGHVKITARNLVNNLVEQVGRFGQNQFFFNTEIIHYDKDENGIFTLKSKNNDQIYARKIILAVGGGAFLPNKPSIDGLQTFEDYGNVHYLVKDMSIFDNKSIAIAGGGDSAVDWALMLFDKVKKIYFIHRRDNMRAHPSSIAQLEKRIGQKLELKIPFIAHQLIGCHESKRLTHIKLQHFSNDGSLEQIIEIDYFLPFFGLKSEIKWLSSWQLNCEQNKICVNYMMQTNIDGIYAIGDICDYAGKTKLLVSCFHEAAVAVSSINNSLIENGIKKYSTFSYSSSKFDGS